MGGSRHRRGGLSIVRPLVRPRLSEEGKDRLGSGIFPSSERSCQSLSAVFRAFALLRRDRPPKKAPRLMEQDAVRRGHGPSATQKRGLLEQDARVVRSGPPHARVCPGSSCIRHRPRRITSIHQPFQILTAGTARPRRIRIVHEIMPEKPRTGRGMSRRTARTTSFGRTPAFVPASAPSCAALRLCYLVDTVHASLF